MKPKIKIPKKGYNPSWSVISAIAFIIIIFTISGIIEDGAKFGTPSFSALLMIFACSAFFLPIVFHYKSLYHYYAPKFRTIEARSVMDMLALGEGKIYEVMNDRVMGFNLQLRYREIGGEEYYVNLKVPDNEVKFINFEKKRLELLGDQPLRGISFHRIPTGSEGDEPMHVGYKFWTFNSESEYMLHVYSVKC